ncbi:hypothetical protein [Actinacidiphila paucisporea]|uniref:Uncharacterized protein n=1 Tax=Actinacidiphila paucisporea TaxID=310782 RepID=A0A1M7PAZ6_9ACTN|nr:hypothetical protein [Actinacidiphila paucisporea]SHN13965.1 hypothetical protein SAMN05216499_12248 [Actinacidiphila paucisporea]
MTPSPALLLEPELVSSSVPPPPEPYRPMARRRLTLVVAAAAVLGVLAGAGAGYQVQRGRTPTPLPPLVAAAPSQPRGTAPPQPPPKVADDRDAVYEADLLKLILPTPKGAKQVDRGWLSQADVADNWGDPASEYGELGQNGFRRAAEAHWTVGSSTFTDTDVTLIQFRDDQSPYTSQMLRENEGGDGDHQDYATPVPGTDDGQVLPSADPYDEGHGLKVYVGTGQARVGSLYLQVFVSSVHPVSRKAVLSVITKQLERL